VRPDPTTFPASSAVIVRLGAVVIGLVALGVFASWRGVTSLPELGEEVAAAGLLGAVGFAVLYALGTVLLVPGTALTIAAGAIYGTLVGGAIAALGALLGAVLAYLVARWAGRAAVEQLLRGRALRVDEWISQRPFRAMLALRLFPLIPFNALNYAAGLSSIQLRSYTAATALGILPGAFLLAAIGGNADQPTSAAFVVPLALFALLVGATGWSARRRRGRPGAAAVAAVTDERRGRPACDPGSAPRRRGRGR
jgi:uncharacterized membrane protein YdjX (TVP38/TMEM64 family)